MGKYMIVQCVDFDTCEIDCAYYTKRAFRVGELSGVDAKLIIGILPCGRRNLATSIPSRFH